MMVLMLHITRLCKQTAATKVQGTTTALACPQVKPQRCGMYDNASIGRFDLTTSGSETTQCTTSATEFHFY
jgi:hypothetical protein